MIMNKPVTLLVATSSSCKVHLKSSVSDHVRPPPLFSLSLKLLNLMTLGSKALLSVWKRPGVFFSLVFRPGRSLLVRGGSDRYAGVPTS